MTPIDIIKKAEEELIKETKHGFDDCVAHDEGQDCCLDARHPRFKKVTSFWQNQTKSLLSSLIEMVEGKKDNRSLPDLLDNSVPPIFRDGYNQALSDIVKELKEIKEQM